MRTVSRLLCVGCLLLLGAATAWGQAAQRDPHIGYVYPAGGEQGSTIWLTVGGQQLDGVDEVYVSGAGVTAASVRYMGRFRPLDKEQREELKRRLAAPRARLQSAAPAESAEAAAGAAETGSEDMMGEGTAAPTDPAADARPGARKGARKGARNGARAGDGDGPGTAGATGATGDEQRGKKAAGRRANPPAASKDPAAPTKKDAIFDNHPLLKNLDRLSLRELDFVENGFFRLDRKMQPNAQLAESAYLELHIDPTAASGDRELRLRTPRGLTNPLCFQVGTLPEVAEPDPYDPRARDGAPLALPIVLNGPIRPGDIDRVSLRAQAGQRLVIETSARHLVPYLADAVPGWFSATLALFDPSGREVAFADHYRFAPDPVLFYTVPETGVYRLEIRDSIYRGREDFVYRVRVGELPYITSIFPLGGPVGRELVATVAGENLADTRLPLDTEAGAGAAGVRTATMAGDATPSNSVTYAVDDLPECAEAEPNDGRQEAQAVTLPRIVNGAVGRPDDADLFEFTGRAGEEIVAEVTARRLQSPLDSLLRLTDAAGKVLAWNDDHVDQDGHLYRDLDLVTHPADSYLRFRLPADGVYRVQVTDAQQGGGAAWAYRLRLGPPRPDFALRVTPSSLNLRATGSAVITAYALRRDGFDGAIDVRLVGAPAGFTVQGGRIPAGRDRVRMTLTAPPEPPAGPLSLHLEGRAELADREVTRRAVPAEDMMQAFLYRHLVPAQELAVSVARTKGRSARPVIVGETPVRIPLGGTARVRIQVPRGTPLANLKLELDSAPVGISIQEVVVSPGAVELVLKAASEGVRVGLADNLIIEAFTERAAPGKNGKPAQQPQRFSAGVLPAVPFEIVE
ncbi:MAG: pre-peptidase C-terminal domain-containing protein [Planctomycetes bacterium]|nr:pre-peptidase C-terminal domain-containing protein [Planctomycetota bacterium]